MESLIVFIVFVNFITLNLCQEGLPSCNDTLVWVGATKKFSAFGLVCDLGNIGEEDIKLQQNLTGNITELWSLKIPAIQINSTKMDFQSIVYDARTKYIAVSGYGPNQLIFYNTSVIWNVSHSKSFILEEKNLIPDRTFDYFPFSNVTGLALATSYNLLYWSDEVFKFIGVLDYTRLSDLGPKLWCKIVDSDLVSPYDIIVHEEKKLIFWADVNPSKIERSNLNGEGRTVIVEASTTGVRRLTIDKSTDFLYWIDGNLKSYNLDGEIVAIYTSPDSINPFYPCVVNRDIKISGKSRGLFEYFTSSDENQLLKIATFHFANVTEHRSTSFDRDDLVKILTNPCLRKPCPHLCIPRDNKKYICKCSTGYSSGDQGICKEGSFNRRKILVRDYIGILYQVDPSNGSAEVILNVQPDSLTNMTYSEDPSGQYIYYTKSDLKTIMRYNVSSKYSTMYYNLSASITDMVADVYSGRTLYVSTDDGQILNLTLINNVVESVILVEDSNMEIKKLYIHPKAGRLFYSDCDSKTVTEIQIGPSFRNLTYDFDVCINSMAFDLEPEYAYYASDKSIIRQELNELTKFKIFQMKERIADFVLDGDFLYVVQFSHNVVKLDKNMNAVDLTQPIFRNAAQIYYFSSSNAPLPRFGRLGLMILFLLASILQYSVHVF